MNNFYLREIVFFSIQVNLRHIFYYLIKKCKVQHISYCKISKNSIYARNPAYLLISKTLFRLYYLIARKTYIEILQSLTYELQNFSNYTAFSDGFFTEKLISEQQL